MHRPPLALRLRQGLLPPPLHLRRPAQRQIQQRNLSIIPRRKHALPRTLYSPNGEPVRYRSVRFTKPPFFTYRRAGIIAVYAGVVYLYASMILRYLEVEIEILGDDEEEAEEGAEAGERVGKEVVDDRTEDEKNGIFYADPDSTFIPLTRSTPLPRTFYKGSDPEWKEFVKVATDKPRHKKIQDDLVALVFTGSTKHPAIKRQLGSEPKVGKYWLDISFPDAPPPEFWRSGIEIGEGYVAWSRQKVSQEIQARTDRVLWPAATAGGVYGAAKVLLGIQYRRVKQALGWEAPDPQAPEERYKLAVEMMEKRQQRRKEGLPNGGAKAGDGAAPGGVAREGSAAASPTAADAAEALTKAPSPSSASPATNSDNPLSGLPRPSFSDLAPADLPVAQLAFAASMAKNRTAQRLEPPRGCFVVQGLVEVKGKRGRVLLDVQSAYDPKAGKYVKVDAAVRGVKAWRQSPKGGP